MGERLAGGGGEEGSESPRPEETPGHRGRGSPGGGGRSPGPAERSSREGGEEGAETQGGGEQMSSSYKDTNILG